MRARKILTAVLALTMGVSLLTACDTSSGGTTAAPTSGTTKAEASQPDTTVAAGAADQYPDRDINGDIIYGAGGGTDLISRAM